MKNTKTTTTTGSVKKGPIEILKNKKAVHPANHEVKIIRADGSFVIVKSTIKKDIQCNIDFNQHNAWLPRKAAAARIITSDATKGLF